MSENQPEEESIKLPNYAHFIAGWPLIMILVGGAIGGSVAAPPTGFPWP